MKPNLLSRTLFTAAAATLVEGASGAPGWALLPSGAKSNLRGVSAVSEQVVWSCGSSNTVLRTSNGGVTWTNLAPPAEGNGSLLDFRDVDAIDARTAYILSIGDGPLSRIYKTTDAGATWKLQFTNQDPKGFYDSMTFWDADHGLVIGDSIDGHFQILITANGGTTWTKVPGEVLPAALPNESAFAASGSNIAVSGRDNAWIGLSALTKCRVLHTSDHGITWSVVDTPVVAGESAGIFSVAFRDLNHGVVVGGDYKKEVQASDNAAITEDGGKTWTLVKEKGLSGFRSAVKYVPGTKSSLVAVGPQGADRSEDDGKTWTPLANPTGPANFHALSFAPDGKVAWASGKDGKLGRLGL